MKNLFLIIRQAILVLLLFTFITGATAAGVWFSITRTENLETHLGKTYLVQNPLDIIYGRTEIPASGKNLFLLGASNVKVGFLPKVLHRFFPDYNIHNLSIGGGNFAQLFEIVQLINEMLTVEGKHSAVFVIGIWHGLFASNSRAHVNVIEGEARPLYSFNNFVLSSPDIASQDFKRLILRFFYPYKPIKKFGLWVVNCLKDFAKNQLHMTSVPIVVNERFKQEAMKKRNNDFGPADESFGMEQLQFLEKIATLTFGQGSKLILVDMPLPDWHRELSPHYKVVETLKRKFFPQLCRNWQLSWFDFPGLGKLDLFLDSTHPSEEGAILWTKDLGEKLKAVIK